MKKAVIFLALLMSFAFINVPAQIVREAARATAVKDKRVNIRLSSGDLMDIQARALTEGMPYQTLIASVLHKYVSGQLVEKKPA